tara:strand:- start:223 stop:1068 length:846 start_codon:yes stop_codon:yes gene_type:complete
MIKFCHIAPTNYLASLTKRNGAHLLLAHLCEKDNKYRDYHRYLELDKEKILDNSAYEMFRQNKEMYPSNKLIGIAKDVRADYIVMSDYPNESYIKTIESAKQMIPIIKDNGFKTFFVPQSEVGDLMGYVECFEWGLNNPDIDLIGVSILGVPNAYNVLKNPLQRYMSRLSLMQELCKQGILNESHHKRLHFLGLLDGPNEIRLLESYHHFISSWDSSSAVWYGLNNKLYDLSPTGQASGKYEKDVDFNFKTDNELCISKALANIDYIQELVGDEWTDDYSF